MIKADENLNISAESCLICTEPSEQAHFSEPVEMSPRSVMLQSNLTKT